MSVYDTWKLNGSNLLCVCGQYYYEVDGPCHVKCDDCKKIIETENNIDGFCYECWNKRYELSIDEAKEAGKSSK